MKLILEGASLLTGSYEDEINESTGSTERNYYISGIFSTPEVKNRNGRVYSRNIWEREVKKYQKEIKEKTTNTLGEWSHPPRSTVDPLKAVMRIVELKLDEVGNVIGKAKILNDNTDQTNKIKGLIKEGIKIGVSSRGVGKVSTSGVVEDFKLITYDAVDVPSDYNAMLNGVVEGYVFENGVMQDKEFEVQENGCIGEVCSIDSVDESKETKCKIQEKIDEAVTKAKDEIYTNINDYLEESFGKIKKEQEVIVEGISDYLSENFKIEDNQQIEENVLVSEDSSSVAESLITALKSISEKEEAKEIINEENITVSEVAPLAEYENTLKKAIEDDEISQELINKIIAFGEICSTDTMKDDLKTAFSTVPDYILDSIYKKLQ